MPQSKRQSRLYRMAMVCALIVVLLNTWLAWRELGALFAAQSWRAHTFEVITHTKALEVNVSKADDSVRGFLLTGNPMYKDRYHAQQKLVDDELKQVRSLTPDNVSQQQRLTYLQQRLVARYAELDAGIAIRQSRSGQIDEVLIAPVMSSAYDGGPTLSYCINQIENEESRLLNRRYEDVKHARIMVWLSFGGASLLDLALIIAAFEFLIRMARVRVLLERRAEEIVDLNVELKSLNADLESRVELRTRELAASNQELEAFSYSVSHDLRAPLRTIDGFSLALQEDFAAQLSDEGRDYISRVRNGVQRMGALIDALLQLSRVTRGELTRDRVDISQMATLVFNELMTGVNDRDVQFVALPGVFTQADPKLLRIALENLIGNAIKYTARQEHAKIEFGSEPGRDRHEGQTVYFIRDNGAGFDMQYVDRLFTAFQRLHGDRDFKGSGIGLATVSRIIRRHHGEIWATGEQERGATFYFTLTP